METKKVNTISPVCLELIDCVMGAACQYFNVSRELLINEYRMANARHICYYIIINSTTGVYDYDIGKFFNRKRTAVQYGIGQISAHKDIYRQTLGEINSIIQIANNFEKKYSWHLQSISITG